MSGFLRRITRSRPADAGEPHPEGRAAEPEGAAINPETPPTASGDAPAPVRPSEAPTTAMAPVAEPQGERSTTATPPLADPQGEPPTGPASDEPATPPKRRRRLFRRRAKAPLVPQPAAPVLLADPAVPAGIDPAAAPFRPPAGRRGRLRRRLRYLRRARELMLRDLGGLLYEIHRTGGGRVDQHATIVRAKVQRIAGLDAEAHAIEGALAAPRSETVVFEPGVGGTCAVCGELFGSDARFCANCGTPIGAKPPETGEQVATEPAKRAFWRRAARPAPPAAAPGDETAETRTGEAAPDEAANTDDATPDAAAKTDEPTKTAGDEGTPEAPTNPGEQSRNPYSGFGNGRPEERKTPGPSSGDPLISRERP